ncbi:DUF3348 family protein [Hydrogenophaga sp.]|uniref:DUF3348 family protein n=1 Tax=Hydrogenophaga sp. TaxID=1904254 RepID=UPI0008BCAB6E|nr:DUF3348 family protein [Hydrogenophaga sp.]OGA77062.1 MAG: hypothetical protein A2X73_11750 [Burkholderiales bacterium GWE1_65_30]OGA90523.1 MAG: hypothetical protein A2X72_11115 [Burkholderiales bacterium GWF1_66_17]
MLSNFNRPALVRQLAGFLPAGAVAPGDAARQDVAERLGQWLNVADAISLSSAHAAIAAAGRQAARTPGHLATSAETLQAELERVRAVLSQSITTRDARHQPDPDDLDTEFAFCLQRYQDQQRRLEMSVDALREHMRQTLAKGTPRLAQLAALDAVLGEMLGGREQRLLNNVPAFLKLRFTKLRRQPLIAENNWLATFNTELEQTLLAELDHRLQPVAGMIEAISHEP